MPKCVGLRVNGAGWQQVGGEISATLNAKQHAEMTKLDQLDGYTPILIVQDAFPCENCHHAFLTKSNKTNIIVKVEKNEGTYSADHKLPDKVGLPVIIYYTKGKASYVHK